MWTAITNPAPSVGVPDPLVAALRDANYIVRAIADLTGLAKSEVAERLRAETQDLGVAVRAEMAERGIEPHQWTPELLEFYGDTAAFLFETTIWNRSPLKTGMRRWIAERLQRTFPSGARVLTYGDGLGFDSIYLAQAGHHVDYYDLSEQGREFLAGLCRDSGARVEILFEESSIPSTGYDAIVCLDVLEHVPEPERVIQQLCQWLRPNGFLFVHAPFWYVTSAVSTHLKSNRAWSGRLDLYRRQGLAPQDAQWLWNPLMLGRSGAKLAGLGPRARLTAGAAALWLGRYWAWPHTTILRWLNGRQLRWPELEQWREESI